MSDSTRDDLSRATRGKASTRDELSKSTRGEASKSTRGEASKSTRDELNKGTRGEASKSTRDGKGARGEKSARSGPGTRGGDSTTRGADTRRSGMRSDVGASRARAGLSAEGDIAVRIEGTAAKRLDTAEAPAAAILPRLRVAPPLPIQAPRPTFAAGLIVLVLAGVVGILLINTKTMEQSFQLDALRKNQASLDERQQELNQQLNQVRSPGNLAAAARRLGLVPAENPAMITLPDGTIIRPLTPGKGQTSVTAQESLTTDGTGAPATQNSTAGQTGTGQNGTGQTGAGQTGAGQTGAGQNGAGQNTADQNAAGTGQ
ncbi:hypothetical protein [Actinoplanes cyaneus]|uniref:hypothetical protein n=1 Tax=Actinoplanes cyaneus TaxID=52696 RepID=UPI00194220B2|nr:hypothetical protein [Actinoplanes cyaneus]